ncbi:unnamed protein product [Protopolystoma xenopodis]|uniref:Uncharacterized protein n=1 Tax=Protopolystoma xenopodis TaxID=117903 RepID=A0A3S5BAK7_9PLAT|nr:unnamed protein product [Protopolystoma xenopodis]
MCRIAGISPTPPPTSNLHPQLDCFASGTSDKRREVDEMGSEEPTHLVRKPSEKASIITFASLPLNRQLVTQQHKAEQQHRTIF